MQKPPKTKAIAIEKTRVPAQIRSLRALFRLELSMMVALSTLAGYLFADGLWNQDMLFVSLGVGFLSAGCSALNQWQEQDLDRQMLRTQKRPLPAGLLTPESVLVLATLTLSSGILLLNTLPYKLPLLLGLLAIIWYNAIYTPLKKRTPFAAIPGAICGALPPLIGWTAAGGLLLTQQSLTLAGTLFIWQIPHTWLLLCRYREDLKRSELPNLFESISTRRLLQINSCWLLALLLCYLLFPLFGFISHPALVIFFLVGLLLLTLLMTKAYLQVANNGHTLNAFHLTNISMALLLSVLILDSIVGF